MVDLENKIKKVSYKNGVIVADAVFSMKGDVVNLPKILELSKKYNLFSYIDEAHSTGVLGDYGHGIVEYYNLDDKPDILMGTLSKALGSEGGYIAGKRNLIDYLRNNARSYIFSTSMPSANISASIKAINILNKDNSLVQKLKTNIELLNSEFRKYNIKGDSLTPIFFVEIGDEKKSLKIANYLMDKGYFIKAIRYPTVKKGEAGLRITLNAEHKTCDIKELAKLLNEGINE